MLDFILHYLLFGWVRYRVQRNKRCHFWRVVDKKTDRRVVSRVSYRAARGEMRRRAKASRQTPSV